MTCQTTESPSFYGKKPAISLFAMLRTSPLNPTNSSYLPVLLRRVTIRLAIWAEQRWGSAMAIPTENVGSPPRPAKLQTALRHYDLGKITREKLTREQDAACQDSIQNMEATGSPIVSDGEQRSSSFATYPLTDTLAGTGLADNLAADGQYFAIFDDGHHRQLPRLTRGPFQYKTFASQYVEKAMKMAPKPLKQAVIAPSMLALLYPLDGEVKGYTRKQFLS